MADIKNVTDYLTPAELLVQLAEEGAELAQAALKLRRAYDGTNPTPKTVGECLDNLQEEVADVLLSLRIYCEADHIDFEDFLDGMDEIMIKKSDRWLERLQKAHPQEGGADGKT